jgi:hypothetical protein
VGAPDAPAFSRLSEPKRYSGSRHMSQTNLHFYHNEAACAPKVGMKDDTLRAHSSSRLV